MKRLQLPNFDHMATSTIWFESLDDSILFQNTIILRSPGVANFAGIIKIAITLTKIFLKNSIKVKRITNYVLLHILSSFQILQKMLISNFFWCQKNSSGVCAFHFVETFNIFYKWMKIEKINSKSIKVQKD